MCKYFEIFSQEKVGFESFFLQVKQLKTNVYQPGVEKNL